MNYRHITFAAAIACAAGAASAAFAGEPRAVIELFTSQGCSSCPPADKLLGELANDPSLVTLSLPVDYWDYLGWKDTLALRGHAKRQRAYSQARGDREVYTPQAVVNGVVHVLGSDKTAIEKAIAKTRENATALGVPVTLKIVDGTITVSVAAADLKNQNAQNSNGVAGPAFASVPQTDGAQASSAADRSAEVWLCPTTNAAPVVIGRGENSGRTLVYHNVVRRWVKLGVWTGKAETFTLPLDQLPDEAYALNDIDRLIVIVQSGGSAKPGVMLGAAQASLR